MLLWWQICDRQHHGQVLMLIHVKKRQYMRDATQKEEADFSGVGFPEPERSFALIQGNDLSNGLLPAQPLPWLVLMFLPDLGKT